MGPAGAGSLATVINAAIAGKARFDTMREFFAGVGEGHAAGVWQDVPRARPEFAANYRRQLEKLAKKRKAEEMI
jgi:chlorophyllide a reductase subunit Y